MPIESLPSFGCRAVNCGSALTYWMRMCWSWWETVTLYGIELATKTSFLKKK